MKFNALFLSFILSLLSLTVIAGTGHDHGHLHEEINQAKAKVKATKVVASFIKDKKLDKSWKAIKVNSAEKKIFQGRSEWVITFVNKTISDIKKQKLYVFLTLTGDYVATNYTGN